MERLDLFDVRTPALTTTNSPSGVDLKPQYWYDLPRGYIQLDVYPEIEKLDMAASQINSLPEPARDRADRIFRLYALVLLQMQRQRVQGCALGMHPDDRGGMSTSVLMASSIPMESGVNPKALVAHLIASGVGDTPEEGVVPVELPSCAAFLTESVGLVRQPGEAERGNDTVLQEPVWQGTVALPDSRSSAVVLIQLVTSATELATQYRNVLLGVASTVTFTDPSAVESKPTSHTSKRSSAFEAVTNDFG
jgi:hypothetical protein